MDGAPPIAVGTVLDGRYRVDRAVGSGGFGTVYQGFHLRLETTVAIKVFRLPEDLPRDARAAKLAAFAEEARLLTRLRHDNIVRTLDQGLSPATDTGTTLPYLVMEWCGEGSLADMLDERRGAPMSVLGMLPLIDAILAGVEHAHHEGIAHRDLKPGNVMLGRGPSGELVPRIIDFGIAKTFDVESGPGTGETRTQSAAIFTPAYASPEQAVGARTGPWTDVHALGLLMVEMLTGAPPYGEGAGISLALIDPVRPSPAARGVDVGPLEAVIAKALAIRPQDRYADAGELRAAIHGATSALALGATQLAPTTLERSEPPQRRADEGRARRRLIRRLVLAGGFALLFAAGFGAALHFGGALDDPGGAGSASASAPKASSAAPPGATASASGGSPSVASLGDPNLGKLTPGAVLDRMTRAGLHPVSPTDREGPTSELMIPFQAGTSSGSVYLNRVPTASPLQGNARTLMSLWTVRTWTQGDKKQGFGLAYIVSGDWVLSMSWAPFGEQGALAKFDALTEGLDYEVRGSSWEGPNPAEEPGGTKKYWIAASPAQLSDLELYLRIEATGAAVTASAEGPAWKFDVTRNQEKGTLRVFPEGSDALAKRHLAALRAKKAPFAFVADGTRHIVAEGAGTLATPAFLADVLSGTDPKISTN